MIKNDEGMLQPLRQALHTHMTKEEAGAWIRDFSLPYRELMAFYRCALMEVETKFRVLNEEFSLLHDSNPIESIQSRLKTPESIVEKLLRNNFPLTVQGIEENLNDVAGIRIITSFVSDVYMLADAFLKQDDVELIRKKDYIDNPKGNGYRSLHLIVSIPIFLHDQKRFMRVEVQIRTSAMNVWASSEHKIRYKKDGVLQVQHISDELLECARLAAELDDRMERVRQAAAGLDRDDDIF